MAGPTKNDVAWQRYFENDGTLARIEADGFAFVEATKLKQLARREPRLLAKHDTLATRPKVFKDHDLAIFPTRNGQYILFPDPEKRSFYEFDDDEIELPIEVYESQTALVDYDSYPSGGTFTTESQAIDFAFVSSLLKTFVGEQSMELTIRGRSRSGQFEFSIPGSNETVEVAGVQIEVDSGYESKDSIYLIEAKLGKRDDFHIRQLYYPYLEWSARSGKSIRTIFLAYSNLKYYLYEFRFDSRFGDLEVVQKRCFTVNESSLATINLDELFTEHPAPIELMTVPFPQANDLDKVADVISLVHEGIADKASIAEEFEFDERQADYYANAACYLGMLERSDDGFQITDSGRRFLRLQSPSARTSFLVSAMAERPVFRDAMLTLARREMDPTTISNADIVALIKKYRPGISGSTPGRRASTVRRWLAWIAQNAKLESL